MPNYDFACFVHVCRTWSVTMTEERSLRTGFIGRYLGLAESSKQGGGEDCMRLKF